MGSRWETGRTEAFSDGVFAIAITLLVLDISIPEADLDELGRGILRQWPAYLAYVTSFLTIGAVWLAHHAVFARLRYVDRRVMRINLVLLMAVSFLPFPTRLIAEAIRLTNAERVAVVFYGTSLFVISLLLAGLWGAVAARRELLRPDVDEREVDAMLRASAPSLGFYALVTLVAILTPHVAAFGYLVIAILLVARARGDDRPEPAASP